MPKLYTIGHSTHSASDFIKILQSYEIHSLMDIRTIPKSQYVPWFNQNRLKKSLNSKEILYEHCELLGGFRRSNFQSNNKGWRNASFRGFADYMQTKDFFKGLKTLIQTIKKHKNVVIMCAEALPWRCHRMLIADAATIRGIHVYHIMNVHSINKHVTTKFSVIDRNKKPMQIYYPYSKK